MNEPHTIVTIRQPNGEKFKLVVDPRDLPDGVRWELNDGTVITVREGKP